MKHILSLSGGKDSTWMLFEVVRRGLPLDEVVFFDTGWEFPQMYEHLGKLKKFCQPKNITFTQLHPKESFDYLMTEKPVQGRNGEIHNGYSWCGLCGCRWGTTMKLKALDNYCIGHTVYVGIAADEPERLAKERKPNKRFCLAEWGITEQECLNGCILKGYDWGGLYNLLDRVSCKYCALKNLKELRNIYKYLPEIWAELQERQRRTGLPYKGEGKSVFQLERRFKFEDERTCAGLSVTNREFYAELKQIIGAESEG